MVNAMEEEEETKALIGALNVVSRNLPLPPKLFHTVSSIHRDSSVGDDEDLFSDLQDALLNQRSNCASASKLNIAREHRYNTLIHHRLTQLQESPSGGGEDPQTKCLLELHGLHIMAILYDGWLDERKAMKEELSERGKFNVLITHYDLIMRDKAFLKKIHWNYLIVDEGHRLKNHEYALARTLDSGYHIQQKDFC